MIKKFDEFINESKMERGAWHGNDAWILDSDNDGVTILVGGYSEADAKKVQKLVKADKDLGEFEDAVEYVEKDDWEEQQ